MVNLPRNQLAVVRVSKCTLLSEILRTVCEDKNLDPAKYEIRHPGNLSERLNLNSTIGEYDVAGVTVVATSRAPPPQLSASDLLAMRRDDKRAKARFLPAPFKKSKSSMGESSASSESYGESGGSSSRGASPSRSDESLGRSISPPAPPARAKKRPAPKPPRPPPPMQVKTVEVNGRKPENECDRVRAPLNRADTAPVLRDENSNSSSVMPPPPRPPSINSNLQKVSSTSSTSVSSANKKRKAPAPPPIVQPPPVNIPVEEPADPQSSPEAERRSSVDSERSSTLSTPSLASSVSPSPMIPQAESTRLPEKTPSPPPPQPIYEEPKPAARCTAPKPACRTNLTTNPPQPNQRTLRESRPSTENTSKSGSIDENAVDEREDTVPLRSKTFEKLQRPLSIQGFRGNERKLQQSYSDDNLLNRYSLHGFPQSDSNDEDFSTKPFPRKAGSVKEKSMSVGVIPQPRPRLPQPASRKKAPPPPPSPVPRGGSVSSVSSLQSSPSLKGVETRNNEAFGKWIPESESDAESSVISDMDGNAGSSATSTDDVEDPRPHKSMSQLPGRRTLEARRDSRDSVVSTGKIRMRATKNLARWRNVASLHEQEIAYNFSDEEINLRRLSLSSESTVEECFQEAIAEGWRTIPTQAEERDMESPTEPQPQSTPPPTVSPMNAKDEPDSSLDWEYTLPEPPTPFKDNNARKEEKVLTILNVDSQSKAQTLLLHGVERNESSTDPVDNNANLVESSTDPLESDLVVTEVPLQFQDTIKHPSSRKSSRCESSSSCSSENGDQPKVVEYKTTAVQCSDLPLLDNFTFGSYSSKQDDDWRNIRCQVGTSNKSVSKVIIPSTSRNVTPAGINKVTEKLDSDNECSKKLNGHAEIEVVNKVNGVKEQNGDSTDVPKENLNHSSRQQPVRKLSRSESFSGSSAGEIKKDRVGSESVTSIQHVGLARGTSFNAPWVVKRVSAFKDPNSHSPVKIKNPNQEKYGSLQNLSSRDQYLCKATSLQNIAPEWKKVKEENAGSVFKEPAPVDKPPVTTNKRIEHEDLKEEYAKLQAKFMQWQQQMMANQNGEKTGESQITNEQVTSMMNEMNEKLSSIEASNQRAEEIKTMSLPRPVAQEKVVVAEEPRAATLDRRESTKKYTYQGPPAVSFQSWEDRPKARRNVKIEASDMYRFGMGRKPEMARPPVSERGTKVMTGSAGTPKGTTVVHLGHTDPKPTVLAKSYSHSDQPAENASTKPEPESLKRSSWQGPSTFSTNIKIGGFRQTSADSSLESSVPGSKSVDESTKKNGERKLDSWNNGVMSSVIEVNRQQKKLEEKKRVQASIVEVNKEPQRKDEKEGPPCAVLEVKESRVVAPSVVQVNKHSEPIVRCSAFPNGEAATTRVNIYDVIKVPAKSTFRASCNHAQETVGNSKSRSSERQQRPSSLVKTEKLQQSSAPPPPPAPVPPAPAPVKAPSRRPNVKQLKQPSLDPREELMIAIRNFDQGSQLKQVSGASCRWKLHH